METPLSAPSIIYTSVSPGLPFRSGNHSESIFISVTPGPLIILSGFRIARKEEPAIAEATIAPARHIIAVIVCFCMEIPRLLDHQKP